MELLRIINQCIELGKKIEREGYALDMKREDAKVDVELHRKRLSLLGEILELTGEDPIQVVKEYEEGYRLQVGMVLDECPVCAGKLTVKDKDWAECKRCKNDTYPISAKAAGMDLPRF